MDQTTIIHMLRTGAIGPGILTVVGLTISMFVFTPLIFKIAQRREGPLTGVLAVGASLALICLPVAAAFAISERFVFGRVEEIFALNKDELTILYRRVKSYEDDYDQIEYKLHKRDLGGGDRGTFEITSYEARDGHNIAYHLVGERLLVLEGGLLRVVSVKDNKLELDHVALAKRQPALAGRITLKGASADGAALWFEDAGGLAYRLDAQTLEVQRERPPAESHRVTSERDKRLGLGWMPSQSVGCEDKQRLSTAPVKDAPRRVTTRFGQEVTPGDGWIALSFLEDPARGCALQPSPAGGAVVLAHSALEYPQLLIAGVDPRGSQLWSLNTGWGGDTQLVVAQRLDDGALLLVNAAGDAALLDPVAGSLRWSVRAAEQASWWGEGRQITLRRASVEGEALTLWLVEDEVTFHLVRRAIKDGALLSSRGF